MMKRILFGIVAIIMLGSCTQEKIQQLDLLITNASIVDVKEGKILENRWVGIRNDTILFVGDMAERDDFEADNIFDAEDQFILPGLWDMHVHFRGGDTLISENKDFLPLFMAYGVTSIRDAGGDITPSVLEWREKIKEGEMIGPTIFTSGPKLDGTEPAWPGSIEVNNQKEIEAALDSLESIGVDYVKMYDGSLTKEAFYNIIQAAEKRGLKTTGHMPLSADFVKAIDYGLDGSEHMYYLLKSCSPLEDSLTKLDLGYSMMTEIVNSYDPELAREVFSKMANQNVSITPTLHISETLSEILQVDHSEDSLLLYIGDKIEETYQGRLEAAKRAEAAGNNSRAKMSELTQDMILPMYDAGVNIVAGSDCGAFNSFVYPGESLHQELRKLVEAGLSPRQALEISVINGPRFFDLDESYGSVTPGKMADLIILSKNPLIDIKNVSGIVAVTKNSQIYNSEQLQNMIQSMKE